VQPACLHSVQYLCQEMCRLFVVVHEANSALSRTTATHCNHPVLFMLLLWLASFPGPAQLSVACSMEKWGEPDIFSDVSMT